MKKTVLLLDFFNNEGEKLYKSLKAAGFDGPVIVCEDDGFLPKGVTSLCRYFCGEYNSQPGIPGRPRYFNQINVPDYWEISGTNRGGKVTNLNHERGIIHYSGPGHKRLVKAVDWTDENGKLRSTDHYDRRGALYARTVFDKNGKRFCKTWFDAGKKEILTENYFTRDVVLNRDRKTFFFKGKTELTMYLLKELGLDDCRLLYNSLSTPFFVSERMPVTEGRNDVLFWQEGPRDDIPGNMLGILNGTSPRTARIYVQKKESFNKLAELGADTKVIKPLGFVYTYGEANTHNNEILICTNSDNIEKLRELVEALPDAVFHVAAITEMSSKLMSMEKYNNVRLYPGAGMETFAELFAKCDYYLDINHENEIVSAVESAFLHNELILGFKETLHNRDFIAPEHIFDAADFSKLAELLRELMKNGEKLDAGLKSQKQSALAEGADVYKKILDLGAKS